MVTDNMTPFTGRVYIGRMGVRVEVCVTSIEEALAAASTGVDSLELCTWLGSGGLSPSWGLFKAIEARCALPVRVLVRPAAGPFQYTQAEQAALLLDAERFARDGAHVVTGALLADGAVDRATMGAVRTCTAGRELTFHRAIDHASDALAAALLCQELGFERILTSGGSRTALEGAATLRRLVDRVPSITIAAAGGIRPDNVVEVVERSGVGEVHFSAQRWVMSGSGAPLLSTDPNASNASISADLQRIEGVLNALTKAGLR